MRPLITLLDICSAKLLIEALEHLTVFRTRRCLIALDHVENIKTRRAKILVGGKSATTLLAVLDEVDSIGKETEY